MHAGRKPPKDEESIRDAMLEHLDQHPPPRPKPKAAPEPPPQKPPPRPHLMLRKMRLDPALERLTRFLELHSRQGTPEVLVIVGRGHGSPGGEPVLAPAARALCERRADLVRSVEEAAPRDGGRGALLVRLRPRSG